MCLSVIGTVIGSDIVYIRQSRIKVLWCCLYVVLSWESDANSIVSEQQRR